ncbi:zinc-dependent metalloprotease [Nocardioides sp. Y6]|uniref:Zinc-dependent metalloprotease n=1 Tax=Nocardioides malaquae TaxID=2773426 RepID=A0ABR9RPT4_9ACTN|nr:zinc-dependent metalloprotease [Nocardioides malaquae]MBE7323538.1 zinc-dependent metalloprotease [Nocardioides malaquae]
MSDSPGGPGPGDDREQNPFKGTPFEQFFSAMGDGGPMPGGMPDLGALMAQFQRMMAPSDGPLNWELAVDTARRTVAQQPDPSPTQRQKDAVADAVRLADLWLDPTTTFGTGVVTATAWSRAEWIVETVEVWKKLVEPMAGSAGEALTKALPEEARAMAAPLLGMLRQVTGAMLANQVGSALGTLAGEVWGSTDVGLPLAAPGRAALVVANLADFGAGLDVSEDDVLLYVALREAAHHRLFAHVPWLSAHLLGAVSDYAAGIEVDTAGIEEQMRGLDLNDLSSMQQAFEGGLFDLKPSPAQQAALQRLEVTLALVEGWVDEVVGQAANERMPTAAKLQEAVRRRRAAGGPAEQTFANLVGLELRPRRLRDASTLWGSLRTRQGIEARDGVWMHPDLLPTAADLDDPLGFREGAEATAALTDEEFEAGLRDLLGGDDRPDAG